MFHGEPRHDSIIYRSGTNVYTLGNLLFTFSCCVEDERLAVALVLPMDRRVGPPRLMDQDLQFYRIKSRARENTCFIAMRSIVRGALIYQDAQLKTADEYFVVDTVDSDMFLRCAREIFPGR